MSELPYGDHVVVHSLQLFLGGVEGIRWRVELICLEALIGEPDFEGLIIFLSNKSM